MILLIVITIIATVLIVIVIVIIVIVIIVIVILVIVILVIVFLVMLVIVLKIMCMLILVCVKKCLISFLEVEVLIIVQEWKDLFKYQMKSGAYSDTPFLVVTAALLQSIIPIAIGQQWSLLNRFKSNRTTTTKERQCWRNSSKTGQRG